jgi:hypothetical protein
MKLDEARDRWRAECARLEAVSAWLDAGKPQPPATLVAWLGTYQRLKTPLAKVALKEVREASATDAFVRLFSAFECEFRAAFSEWLANKSACGAAPEMLDEALPESLRTVLNVAAVLEPRFDRSRAGYVGSVIDRRNKLVHGGFASQMPYDLDDLHTVLSGVVATFKT